MLITCQGCTSENCEYELSHQIGPLSTVRICLALFHCEGWRVSRSSSGTCPSQLGGNHPTPPPPHSEGRQQCQLRSLVRTRLALESSGGGAGRPKLSQKNFTKETCWCYQLCKKHKTIAYEAKSLACSLANRDTPVAVPHTSGSTTTTKIFRWIISAIITNIFTKRKPKEIYCVTSVVRMVWEDQ